MKYANIAINLKSNDFKFDKKHPYTIEFKATCPTYRETEFVLKYTGTELTTTVALPDYMDSFKILFQNWFGYGPFEKEDIKNKLKRKSLVCQ